MRPEAKRLSLDDAVESRSRLRAEGKTLTLTNGCFDLLHAGHVHFLTEAAEQGDALWVLINSDASVRALKGPSRPVQTEAHRAYVLAALACVGAVLVFPDPRLDREIREIQPDLYVKAGDYTSATLDPGEKAALEDVGAEIRFLPFWEGFSTTGLIRRIAAADAAG